MVTKGRPRSHGAGVSSAGASRTRLLAHHGRLATATSLEKDGSGRSAVVSGALGQPALLPPLAGLVPRPESDGWRSAVAKVCLTEGLGAGDGKVTGARLHLPGARGAGESGHP